MATTRKQSAKSTVKKDAIKRLKSLHPRGETGKRPREVFAQHELLSWLDSVAGVAQVETARKLHVTRETVRAGRDKVAEFVGQRFDINSYRMPLFAFYPEIVASILANLRKHDVTMTIAVCKGLQIFVDKQVNETEDVSKYSNDELIQLISRRLGATAE